MMQDIPPRRKARHTPTIFKPFAYLVGFVALIILGITMTPNSPVSFLQAESVPDETVEGMNKPANDRLEAPQQHVELLPVRIDFEYATGKLPNVNNVTELERSYKGYAFNSELSDQTAVDRTHKDYRAPECQIADDEAGLPSMRATIVIIFHNELLSALMRSVISVLDYERSPWQLLAEVILVDDFSDQTAHPRLGAELDGYIRDINKQVRSRGTEVRVIRLPERYGLMRARMAGAAATKFPNENILYFLDSHIEVTKGWLWPIVRHLQNNKKDVLVPSIDQLESVGLTYLGSHYGLGVLGYSWTMGQVQMQRPHNKATDLTPSPIMAGGLFAVRMDWWNEFEGYDEDLRVYGGEEIEIGLKVWQCGGRILLNRCSRIGHIFRDNTHFSGQVYKVEHETIMRNKLRVAEVWMDEYKYLYHRLLGTNGNQIDFGDTSKARAVRDRLKCKDHKWFLDNVYPEQFIPDPDWFVTVTLVTPPNTGNWCLDTMGKTTGGEPGIFGCHGQGGTQSWLFVPTGGLIAANGNLEYSPCPINNGVEVHIQNKKNCDKKGNWLNSPSNQRIYWVPVRPKQPVTQRNGRSEPNLIWDLSSSSPPPPEVKCLTTDLTNKKLKVAPCVEKQLYQYWDVQSMPNVPFPFSGKSGKSKS